MTPPNETNEDENEQMFGKSNATYFYLDYKELRFTDMMLPYKLEAGDTIALAPFKSGPYQMYVVKDVIYAIDQFVPRRNGIHALVEKVENGLFDPFQEFQQDAKNDV